MSSKGRKSLESLWKQSLAVRNPGGLFPWKVLLEYKNRESRSLATDLWPCNSWNPNTAAPVEIASWQKHFAGGIRRGTLFSSIHILCVHLNCFFLMITPVTPKCRCLQASHWIELVARGKRLWSWPCSLHSEPRVSYQETRMVLNWWIILLSLNGRCWKQFQHGDHVLSPREKVHTQIFLWNYRAKVYVIFALSFSW